MRTERNVFSLETVLLLCYDVCFSEGKTMNAHLSLKRMWSRSNESNLGSVSKKLDML